MPTELELRLEARIAEPAPERAYRVDWSPCPPHHFDDWKRSEALGVTLRECSACGLIEGYAR